MPTSYPYAIARIHAIGMAPHPRDRLARLCALQPGEFCHALEELGLPAAESWEESLHLYKVQAHALLTELAPEPRLLHALWRATDAHNLKVLLKGRVLGRAVDSLPYGATPIAALERLVDTGEPGEIAPPLATAALRVRDALPFDPFICDASLDAAAHRAALQDAAGNRFVTHLLVVQAEYTNACIALRALWAGWPKDRVQKAFLPTQARVRNPVAGIFGPPGATPGMARGAGMASGAALDTTSAMGAAVASFGAATASGTPSSMMANTPDSVTGAPTPPGMAADTAATPHPDASEMGSSMFSGAPITAVSDFDQTAVAARWLAYVQDIENNMPGQGPDAPHLEHAVSASRAPGSLGEGNSPELSDAFTQAMAQSLAEKSTRPLELARNRALLALCHNRRDQGFTAEPLCGHWLTICDQCDTLRMIFASLEAGMESERVQSLVEG